MQTNQRNVPNRAIYPLRGLDWLRFANHRLIGFLFDPCGGGAARVGPRLCFHFFVRAAVSESLRVVVKPQSWVCHPSSNSSPRKMTRLSNRPAAPKKKEQQKMSLGDFLTDGRPPLAPLGSASCLAADGTRIETLHAHSMAGFGGGSWADEVEETYGKLSSRSVHQICAACR